MKSKAPNALLLISARQGKSIDRRLDRTMEGSVEAANLWKVRSQFHHGADRRDTTRLMHRCERRKAVYRGDHRWGEKNGIGECRATMDDAVTASNQAAVAKIMLNPLHQLRDPFSNTFALNGAICLTRSVYRIDYQTR